MTSSSEELSRFTVTRTDGTATAQAGAEQPGPVAAFQVRDAQAGQLLAVYSSADVAVGLPPAARIRVAERRAADHLAQLVGPASEGVVL